MADKIQINRAPVLALWGAVVAERLGYESDTALSLGKCLAGLNAQAKGRRLGIYGPSKGPERGHPLATLVATASASILRSSSIDAVASHPQPAEGDWATRASHGGVLPSPPPDGRSLTWHSKVSSSIYTPISAVMPCSWRDG